MFCLKGFFESSNIKTFKLSFFIWVHFSNMSSFLFKFDQCQLRIVKNARGIVIFCGGISFTCKNLPWYCTRSLYGWVSSLIFQSWTLCITCEFYVFFKSRKLILKVLLKKKNDNKWVSKSFKIQLFDSLCGIKIKISQKPCHACWLFFKWKIKLKWSWGFGDIISILSKFNLGFTILCSINDNQFSKYRIEVRIEIWCKDWDHIFYKNILMCT